MTDKEITDYILEYEFISVPFLQKNLGLSYLKAKCAIDEMTRKGDLIKKEGIMYEVKKRPAPVYPSDKAKLSPLAERFARLAKQQQEREQAHRQASEELNDLEKKALWLFIQNGVASPLLAKRGLGLAPSTAFAIVDKLKEAGFVSATTPHIPEITEKEFLKRFGAVTYEPQERSDDEDDSADDKNADEGAQEEAQPSEKTYRPFITDYMQLRSALSRDVGNFLKFSMSEGWRQITVNVRGEARFKIVKENERIVVSDFGKIVVPEEKQGEMQLILSQYPGTSYENGAFVCKMEENDMFSAFMDLYAVTERVKNLK